MRLLHDRRVILIACLLVALAAEFWGGSRYPALNEKLLMGTETPLSGLAFSPLLKIAPGDTAVMRVVRETINWTYTNRQGMTFGILFGALVMTLLPLVNRTRVRNRFTNSAMGLLAGAPLGVCVNCAVPIGKGIHAAGGSVETMLAAMVSSPTLNVVVLTMVFSLFPPYMAIIKIAFTLGFILIGVPLLTRLTHTPARIVASKLVDMSPPLQSEVIKTWIEAVVWVAKSFGRNLWFVVKTTVP